MKVIIRGRPVFDIEITLDQIKMLKLLAKQHYDGACQRAALSISDYQKNLKPGVALGADIRNGLLVIWEMHFEYAEDKPKSLTVTVTSDDVDLLSKITEIWVAHNALNPEQRRFALDFHSALSQAWHVAQSTVPLWTKVIETV